MNKYNYLGNKLLIIAGYSSKIALISFPIYIILAAKNTGDMFLVTYVSLLVFIVALIQSVILKIIGTVLIRKGNK